MAAAEEEKTPSEGGGEEEDQMSTTSRSAEDDSWTDSISQKISSLTSPLLDRLDGHAKEAREAPVDIPMTGDSVYEHFMEDVKDMSPLTLTSCWTFLEPMRRDLPSLVDRLMAAVGDSLHAMQDDPLAVGIVSSVVLLLLLLLVRRRRVKRGRPETTPVGNRARAVSFESVGMRARAGSRDLLLRKTSSRERTKSDDSHNVFLSGEQEDTFIRYGPAAISYDTWTPPLQWSEASRQLIPPKVTSSDRQCTLTFNMKEGTLQRRKDTYSAQELSMHVKPPNDGGVLEIYRQGDTNQGEWNEHTFHSAKDAAQFQQDLITYQVIGESIVNMYEALELVHKGSLAHDGKECVLHDDTSDTKKGAVAWDDCMRCFSGIAPVRQALERELHDNEEQDDDATAALVEDYVNKRYLLGIVEFFRLFCPAVEDTALPRFESSPERVEAMLERRKQVAQAAVMVQAYVHARKVANKGWNLTEEEELIKRLAYDHDVDNKERDSSSQNEYYEATVSRDVRCDVHSIKHLSKPGSSTVSPYQAYTLVGSHVFKLPPEGEEFALSYKRDPVLALPSLRTLVESNPELDFFVCSFFPEGLRVAFVQVFVRSLPKGVDTSFDTIMDRFVNGTVEVRRRKLEVFMQLGPGAKLSPLAWAALKAVSLLLSWSRKGEAQIPFEGGADRTVFPGMTMNNYTETHHFGGSLQSDATSPKNYVSVTSHVDASNMHMAFRILYQRLEEGALPASVVDFTYVLEGQQLDELPERALGSIRLVHVDPVKVGLPTEYCSQDLSTEDLADEADPPQTPSARPSLVSSLSSYGPRLVSDVNNFWNSVVGSAGNSPNDAGESPNGVPERSQELQEKKQKSASKSGRNSDPFQAGVDALTDILRDVTVPVRRENLSSSDEVATREADGTIQPESSLLPPSMRNEDVVNVPVLSRTSPKDIRRYFRATNCDLKEAAVRIVESAAWRGITFPIDTQKCRIELQSGQCFQQGNDVDGDPVFYFQNTLRGPWRENVDASVAALLHRLESSLDSLSKDDPDVKCTAIVLLGKPLKKVKRRRKAKGEKSEHSSVADESVDESEAKQGSVADDESTEIEEKGWNPFRLGTNPRVQPGEDYHVHSNIDMITRLADLLSSHYPERLKRLLLVTGGSTDYLSAALGVRKYIASPRTRAKVVQVNGSELRKYVEEGELATIVGGTAEVIPLAFECSCLGKQ